MGADGGERLDVARGRLCETGDTWDREVNGRPVAMSVFTFESRENAEPLTTLMAAIDIIGSNGWTVLLSLEHRRLC